MTIEKIVEKNRKKATEPPYEDYLSVGLTEGFKAKVEEYKLLAQVEEQAKSDRKKLSEEIKAELAERGRDRVLIGDRKVLAYEGKSTHINKALLLENGVGMDVIEASTKTTTYITIGVYAVKD